jgi:hypothetical protein
MNEWNAQIFSLLQVLYIAYICFVSNMFINFSNKSNRLCLETQDNSNIHTSSSIVGASYNFTNFLQIHLREIHINQFLNKIY